MDFSSFFNNQFLLSIVFKTFSIVFSGLYLLFSISVYRQVKIMHQSLQTKQGPLINLISLLQIFLALAVFLIAILIL